MGYHETHLPGLHRTRVHSFTETKVTPPTTFHEIVSVDLSLNDAKRRRKNVRIWCVRHVQILEVSVEFGSFNDE